ncbi:MAG: YceI family protein [Actinomycetota bacterium]
MNRRSALRLALIGIVLLVVGVVGGTWLYINVIKEDAPAPLAAPSPPAQGATGVADASSFAGTWTIAEGSVARYRVQEILFGQRSLAVGETRGVEGSLTVVGSTLQSGEFSVDMTTVTSPESRRDNQFRTRIMETDRYPTASFKLTQPVQLTAGQGQKAVEITGDLTLHGTTRSVTFTATSTVVDPGVDVTGTIPVVFADYNIANPSGGPAQTEDHGILEFSLKFARS